MNHFIVAQSSIKDTALAAKDIQKQLAGIEACMVFYFASATYPAEDICREMAAAFPKTHTVGCSSMGEMSKTAMTTDSIVAMAWRKESMKSIQIEVLQNISTDKKTVEKAFKSFERKTGVPMAELDPSRYVGIVMIDGMSACEDEINDHIGNLTNVSFMGGSAADMFTFSNTYVYVDGKAYANAAALILIEPSKKFAVLKTQSLEVTDKEAIITKLAPSGRQIMELNNRPAAEVYAEMVGVPLADLGQLFMLHPLGVVLDKDHFFVRSPAQVHEDKSISFHCAFVEGMEVTLLRSFDIISETKKDLEKINCEKGPFNAVIDFNCCFRVVELRMREQEAAYVQIFKNFAAIGMGTYGESYIGHMNQTSVMLLLE